MGIKEFYNQTKKDIKNFTSIFGIKTKEGIAKTKDGIAKTISTIKEYTKTVKDNLGFVDKKDAVFKLDEISEKDFDTIARARGYIKADGDAISFDETKIKKEKRIETIEFEEELDSLPYEPLSREEFDQFDILYYAKYLVDIRITYKNGDFFYLSEKKKDFPKEYTTHKYPTMQGPKQEIKHRLDNFVVGESGKAVVVSLTLYEYDKNSDTEKII